MSPIIVDKEKKKKLILDAALSVFTKKGFYPATMSEIARAANIGKGTVYEYFPGKEKLFLDLCSYFVDKSKNACVKRVSSVSEPEQKIKEFINFTISSFKEFKDFCFIFFEIWSRMGKRRKKSPVILKMRRIYEDYKKMLSGYIKEGMASGVFRKDIKPDYTAAVILATLDGLMVHWVTDHQAFSLKRMKDAVLAMISKSLLTLILALLLLSPVCFAGGDEERIMVLTEKEAIETALKYNRHILSKEQEIKGAKARLAQVRSQAFPHISASAHWTRYEDHPVIPFDENRGYSFSLNQLLFAGGRVLNTIDSARNALKATEMGKKELENKIIYNTRQAFYGILLAKEFVGIRKETLQLAEESLSVTKERYRKGEASHYDLLRSKVEVANITPQLIRAKNRLEISYNFLKALLGIDPTRQVKIDGEFDYTPEALDLDKELAFALERRPALKEIALQKQAAQAEVRRAFSGHLPEARFVLTNFANQKEAVAVGREEYDDYWIATISVSMPLFDGFLTRSKVREAKAEEEKVRILKDKLTDSVKLEVENTVLDLEAAARVVESQKENVLRAKEAYEIIRRRHLLGEAMQLDLLNSRVALSTARLNYAQSLYDFIVARAKLEYVTGGE